MESLIEIGEMTLKEKSQTQDHAVKKIDLIDC